MDTKALEYFSLVNPLARKIIHDEKLLQDAVGDEWNKMDWRKQEELIDDFMVDISVRENYANLEKSSSYPSSFPNLKLETGEKIIVDFENDCWTWQDEHSSPFSWRTKSQQDLTLMDLEPDVLSKPQAKPKKKTSDSSQADTEKLAPREFSVETGTSIWESPFLQGMKKPDFLNRSRSSSPTKSVATSKESLASRPRSPEEINYAFTGSVDDLSSNPGTLETDRSPSVSSGEVLGSPVSGDGEKSKAHKRETKSPMKTIVNVTNPKKTDKHTELKSLVKVKELEEHAFDNPALGDNDWSSFVNENVNHSESSTSLLNTKSISEPEPVFMDRGGSFENNFNDEQLSMSGRSGFDSDFKDEQLVVEIENRQDEPAAQNISITTKTGFDFLDNW